MIESHASQKRFLYLWKAVKHTKIVNGKKETGAYVDLVYIGVSKYSRKLNGKYSGTHVVNNGSGKYKHMEFCTVKELQSMLNNGSPSNKHYNAKDLIKNAKEGQVILNNNAEIQFLIDAKDINN